MVPQNEKTKILVIDDERLIRLMLSAKLKLIGYTAVCVASISEGVVKLNEGGYKEFKAIITDIMMGDMDGFNFRDIVRGRDATMPIFFMTALDPEEGSGFLKQIMEDGCSFYLPKSIKPDLLLKRVQSIVDSRRVDELIRAKDREVMESLTLGAHLQRSMLPPRARITDDEFYTFWWMPKDIVSGDLLEVMPLPGGGTLYILGDIQGHGASASLSMMAVQSFLKQLPTSDNFAKATPATIANQMHRFFTDNLGTFSYMTALICIHRPEEGIVDWISCGAPGLSVFDPLAEPGKREIEANPEHRGNLPIGLVPDAVYTENDVVRTRLSESALCVAFSDGLFDVYKGQEGQEPLSDSVRAELQDGLLAEAWKKNALITFPYKFQLACEACGYSDFADDVTELIFGARLKKPDVLIKSIPMDSVVIDETAQEIEKWCTAQTWDPELVTKVELVFEEKMMNLYDHGYDIRDRSREQACFKLQKRENRVDLTIWDWGTQEPSIPVAVGSTEVELDLKNRDFSGRGRGRLMVRKVCCGIERNRFGALNETIYHIPAENQEKQ